MSHSDRKLEAIAPADLSSVWPLIREEVAAVEAPDGFIPEDAYAMCRANEATLFLLHVNGGRAGWMVLRILGADLHIWLVYAENGHDVLTVFRPDLMEIARTARARKITFGSTRRGWERVAPQHGFKLRQVVYECDVDIGGVS